MKIQNNGIPGLDWTNTHHPHDVVMSAHVKMIQIASQKAMDQKAAPKWKPQYVAKVPAIATALAAAECVRATFHLVLPPCLKRMQGTGRGYKRYSKAQEREHKSILPIYRLAWFQTMV